MLKEQILKDLQVFIEEHAKMEQVSFNMSRNANTLGYPGFSHFFQVQAQDEFLHQRRIMNYIMDRGNDYKINQINLELKEYKDIFEILNDYKEHRAHFAKITAQFYKNAFDQLDMTTARFYDWFIIDFYEEISETDDLIDWLTMSNNNHYAIDKKVGQRENPNTEAVVDPFAPHQ